MECICCCRVIVLMHAILLIVIAIIIKHDKGNPITTIKPTHPPLFSIEPTKYPTMKTVESTHYPTIEPTIEPSQYPTIKLNCKQIRWEIDTKNVNYSTINYYLDAFIVNVTNNEINSNEYIHFEDVIINEDYIAFTECESPRFYNTETKTIYNDLILPIYMDHLKPESTSFESIQKDNTFAICNYKTDFECYGGLQPLSFIDTCCFFDTQKNSTLSNNIQYIQQLSLSSLIIESSGPIILIPLFVRFENRKYGLVGILVILVAVFSLDIATVIIATSGINNPITLTDTLIDNQCYSVSGQSILEEISGNLKQIAVLGVAEAMLDLSDLGVNISEMLYNDEIDYDGYDDCLDSNKFSVMRIVVFLCFYFLDLILTSINYFVFVRPALNKYKSLQEIKYHCYDPSFVFFE